MHLISEEEYVAVVDEIAKEYMASLERELDRVNAIYHERLRLKLDLGIQSSKKIINAICAKIDNDRQQEIQRVKDEEYAKYQQNRQYAREALQVNMKYHYFMKERNNMSKMIAHTGRCY
jgi:hypothetical protein